MKITARANLSPHRFDACEIRVQHIKQSIQYVIYGTLQSAMQSVSVRGAGGALARSHARTLARSHALTARTARSHAHTNAHTPPPRLCSRLFLSARLPHTRAARAALASRLPPIDAMPSEASLPHCAIVGLGIGGVTYRVHFTLFVRICGDHDLQHLFPVN